MKPEAIDNQKVTLAQALDDLAHTPGFGDGKLDIATGFVDLYGLLGIESFLDGAQGVRIMLGAEPSSPLPEGGDPGGPVGLQVKHEVAQLERMLEARRNSLPFSKVVAEHVVRIAQLLEQEPVEVRRYVQRFLHGKVYLFQQQGVIAGSNNLTGAGLRHNLEFAVARYDSTPVRQAQEWFDGLWEGAGEYKEQLIDLLTARDRQTFNPYEVYLRALLELYEPELAMLHAGALEPGKPGGLTPTEFQQHGIQRALAIIDKFDGVLVADGVGLGKSTIGAKLLEHFALSERVNCLVVVPASLRDMWRSILRRQNVPAHVVSYQELADDEQLGGGSDKLKLNKDLYRFVLVDEAHAFRHTSTNQYRALDKLMGGTRKQLALMTATPVNNSIWDLYNQIMLFARHGARFKSIGVPDLQAFFKHAEEQARDGHTEAATNATFQLMDQISVRRTRKFIKEHYKGQKIDGELIRFPEPHLKTTRYELDRAYPDLFLHVQRVMSGELEFARYQPDNFRLDDTVDVRGATAAGLLRTNLFKRFESSVYAFAETCRKMVAGHDEFLAKLAEGYVLVPADRVEAIEIAEDDDPAEFQSSLDFTANPASLYDVAKLQTSVENDRALLQYFLELVGDVRLEDDDAIQSDPKLDALSTILTQRVGDNDEKVIIFTYYADTVNWIKRAVELDQQSGGARFGHRQFVTVTGGGGMSHEERAKRVRQFSPETADGAQGVPAGLDPADLLITTDTLAEGHNLQQARHIVNFDMPWNPMRVVQRNGRIDRIGSPHETIFLHNLFPAGDLDAMLGLYDTLLRKIGVANIAVGMEAPIFEDTEAADINFASAKGQIVDIANEDDAFLSQAEAGIDAFSGEEFRMQVRQALQAGTIDDIRHLPHGAGSGLITATVPANAVGVFFGVRLLLGEKTVPSELDRRAWHYVPLENATPSEFVTDELEIIRMIRCEHGTPRHIGETAQASVHDLWQSVQDHVIAEWNRKLDPAYAPEQIPPSQQRAINLLTDSVNALEAQGIKRSEIGDARAALGVQRSVLVQRLVNRECNRWKQGEQSQLEAAQGVLEVVRERGLRPPDDEEIGLQTLTAERVRLICYQVVEGER